MTPTETGTPTPAEQGQQATPQSTEQSTQQAAPIEQQNVGQTATTPTTAPVDASELQARLAQLESEKQRLDESARYHQSQASRFQQALQAAAGVNQPPQADPIKPYVDKLASELPGVDADQLRVLAKRDYENDQRFSRMQTAFQAQNQVPSVMQQVYQTAPELAADPVVWGRIESDLREQAAQGNFNAVHPEYAITVGLRYAFDQRRQQPRGTQPPAPPQQIPQFNSQFGPIAGYAPQPPQPVANSIPPHLKAAADAERAAIQKKFGFQQNP